MVLYGVELFLQTAHEYLPHCMGGIGVGQKEFEKLALWSFENFGWAKNKKQWSGEMSAVPVAEDEEGPEQVGVFVAAGLMFVEEAVSGLSIEA